MSSANLQTISKPKMVNEVGTSSSAQCNGCCCKDVYDMLTKMEALMMNFSKNPRPKHLKPDN